MPNDDDSIWSKPEDYLLLDESPDRISDVTNENLLRRMRPHLSTIRYGLDRLIREVNIDGDVKGRAREALKFLLIEDELT